MTRSDSVSNAGSRQGVTTHHADWHFDSDLVFSYGNKSFTDSHRLQDQLMHLTKAQIGDTVRKVGN